MGRQENIDIFKDTKQFCHENVKLKEAIKRSNARQQFYPETKENANPKTN